MDPTEGEGNPALPQGGDVVSFPTMEDRIDTDAAYARDPDAVAAGMMIYARLLHRLVREHPKSMIHPVVQEGIHHGWCVHSDSDSGLGCRDSALIDTVIHVLETHPDGGNCGY